MAPTQGNIQNICGTDIPLITSWRSGGLLCDGIDVPVEAKMLGELCEDEVFSQQGVRLSRLYQLLRGLGN